MKPTPAQLYFLGGALIWMGVLQSVMFWYVETTNAFVCNSGGAWPFSQIPLLGGALLTVLLTIGLGAWAWKMLKADTTPYIITAWALMVGSGLSHSIERLTSGCVLDYWRLADLFYFNLGDVALTLGVMIILCLWLQRRGVHAKNIEPGASRGIPHE